MCHIDDVESRTRVNAALAAQEIQTPVKMAVRILRPPWPLLLGTSSLLFVMMIASFTPTPLYPLYQEQWGLVEGQIGLAFSAYSVSVILTLLFLGGMSDRFGRRDTLIIATLILGVALIILSCATAFPGLLLGRFVQGIGAALASGAGAATLMESHPGGLARGSLFNTFSVAVGLAIGPLLAGSLAAGTAYPLVVPYLIVGLLLPLPLFFLIRAKDAVPKRRDASLFRPIRLPRHIWAAFSVAAAALIGPNICLAIYGSFGSNIAASVGWNTEALSGLLVSLVLLMFAAVQPFSRNLHPKVSMFIGIGFNVAGWVIVSVAAIEDVVLLMVLGSMILGGGAGLCLMGSATLVGSVAPAGRSAEIYSVFLIVGFITLGTTALTAGSIIDLLSINAVLGSASVSCFLLAIYVIYGSRRWLTVNRFK